MANTYGIQPIPFANVEGFPAGDVGLGHFGFFLRAAINRALASAFDGVCPNREAVRALYFHNPAQLFQENHLPALFVWRGKSKRSRLAADIRQGTSTIEVGWISEPAQESHMVLREPIAKAVLDAVDEACFLKRCPSYVVVGDTESLASTRGSLITTFAGFSTIEMGDGDPKVFDFGRVDGDGKPLPYYGFTFGVDVTEQLTIDPSVYNSPASIHETNTVNGIAWSQLDDPTGT